MAYYSNKDIDDFDQKVSVDKNKYAELMANGFTELLNKHPEQYKRFGTYWWDMKAAIRKYVHNGRWYCGDADDAVMRTRANHGSEYRNILAACVYFSNHIIAQAQCDWEDENGLIHPYTLIDTDAPA